MLRTLKVIGIAAVITAITIPVIRVGLAFKGLLDTAGIASLIRNSPLDEMTKRLLKQQVDQIATQYAGGLFDAFGQLAQSVLLEVVGFVLAGLVLSAVFKLLEEA